MEAVAGASANRIIKVAALCGCVRKGSYNCGLIRSAMQLSKESVNVLQIEQIDISPLPLINADLEVNGTFPPVVKAFRQQILKADCILFASPEYNYSVAAPLKNAIDWASRPPNCWADKAAAIISTAGGFGGGQSWYHLRQIGVFLDLHFINKPKFFIKAFEPKFDSEGNLIDPQAKERLKEVLLSLYAFTLRLKEELNKSMAKNVTARIYNGTGYEINLVEKFSWCGNFVEHPPIRISSGEVGVLVLQCPPENPNALGGAVVYRNKATASDVMVAFDNPDFGIPSMTTTRIRGENYFAGKKNEIHDILWADRSKFAEDKADIISMTSITQDWQATCMAVLRPRI